MWDLCIFHYNSHVFQRECISKRIAEKKKQFFFHFDNRSDLRFMDSFIRNVKYFEKYFSKFERFKLNRLAPTTSSVTFGETALQTIPEILRIFEKQKTYPSARAKAEALSFGKSEIFQRPEK